MEVHEAIGMSVEDMLKSDRIAIVRDSTGMEFVRHPSGQGWCVAGLGFVGLAMKAFTNEEMTEILTLAETVVVQPHINNPTAYIARRA